MINAEKIKEHMVVMASDGEIVGKVDHMEGSNKIKLTKNESPDGQHHYIPLDWVKTVDEHVHLARAAGDVRSQWH